MLPDQNVKDNDKSNHNKRKNAIHGHTLHLRLTIHTTFIYHYQKDGKHCKMLYQSWKVVSQSPTGRQSVHKVQSLDGARATLDRKLSYDIQ